MNQDGVIYMSIPSHSPITRQNRSKNERATSKGSKIMLLGLCKIKKSKTNILNEIFDITFKKKHRTTRSMGLGGYLQGYNVSVPVCEFEHFLILCFIKCQCKRKMMIG